MRRIVRSSSATRIVAGSGASCGLLRWLAARAAGRVSVKTAPGPSGRLAARRSPRWARAISRAIARPRPVPSALVVKNGSNRCVRAPRARGPGRCRPRSAERSAARRVEPGRQPEHAACRHGLERVGRQVAEDLQQGGRGHRDRGQVGVEVDLDADPLRSAGAAASRAASATTAFRSPGARSWASARENWRSRETIPSSRSTSWSRSSNDSSSSPRPALPELGGRADAGQRVADLVRDARQQLAERRQPLAAPQLGLEPVALGRLAADRPRQARASARGPARSRPGARPAASR